MHAHPRVFMRRLKTHLVKRGWIWLSVFLSISLFSHAYHFAINRTHSLPFSLFLIERGQSDVTVGDYVAFRPKRGSVGGFDLTFVKEVACGPGQTISVRDRQVHCDGVYIARAKPISLKGEALETIPEGVIPDDHYFVRGTHRDSFDSRYARFGLIDRCRFVGKATPIF